MKDYLNTYSPEKLSEMALVFASRRVDELTKVPGQENCFTPVELLLITKLGDNPGLTVTDLSKYFGRTKGAVSQMVKKLRAKGVLCGTEDEMDKKKIHLSLTAEGRKLFEARMAVAHKAMNHRLESIVAEMGAETVNAYFAVIDKVNSMEASNPTKR